MNDKTGFSVGIKVDPHKTFKPLPDRVALDLCKAYPVPGGNVLLRNTLTGKRCMAMPEVFASLTRCIEFKTIEQHTAKIIEQNPAMADQADNIGNVLKQMLETGIMVSAEATCKRISAKTKSRVTEKDTTGPVVAIITWERPQALERLLESIVENCQTKSFHRLYVLDDSRNPDNINKNKEITENFASKVASPLLYFGQDEQKQLIDSLVEKLPAHETSIRFLIDQSKWKDQWTSGLNRNLALLLSCGRRLVMLDDDTICDVFEPPRPRSNITVSDTAREVDIFAGENDWAHLRQPLNPDPVSRHMQCLGLSLSEAIEKLGDSNLSPAGLQGSTALQVSELQAESRVLVTECGSLGCPGASDNTWLPDMPEESLKKMLKSENKTTLALTKRKVWSGRSAPHFAPRPNISQITGFDNRETLPPYLPILRGEDELFGLMLDFLFPSSVTLDYPWAIPHLPLPDREWQEKDLSFRPQHNFPKFFYGKVLESKSECLSSSSSDRLEFLSSWFRDLAAASDASLKNTYQDSSLSMISQRLIQLDRMVNSGQSSPVNWQNYLRNGVTQLNAALDRFSSEDFPVKGLPKEKSGEELISFWKNVWLEFADTLIAWPNIRKAAQESLSD